MALQKQLRGFSDFIGLFRGGNSSIELNNTLQPVLGMEDFLSERKSQAFSTTLTAAGQFSSVVVPPGKRWSILCVSTTFDSSAALSTQYYPMFRKNFGASAFFGYLATQFADWRTINGDDQGYTVFPTLILDADDEIGVILESPNGPGNFNFDFFVQYREWSV